MIRRAAHVVKLLIGLALLAAVLIGVVPNRHRSLPYFQGVTALRRGENDNCIDCRGDSSCILPIVPEAVHVKPAGTREAIRHFTEYLERFLTSEYDIGRFRDVGRDAGVDRLNQAGGAVMDDFDGDGRLDLAVTAMDQTQAMSFYHNRGDGTFEDRSESAGVTGQIGGLVCYRTDHNNDGRPDLFIPRGAWLPFPIRPSLLRNDGGGHFTDVTAEARLAEPLNSNASAWADYDNDRDPDLFVNSMSGLSRLYRNDGGRFAEITGSTGTGHLQKGHAVAFGNHDADGDVDVFIQMGGSLNGDRYHNILFGNPGQGHHWLSVKLIGRKTNRAAIGARIKVVTAGEAPMTIHRHLSSGSSFGANPLRQTIGAGEGRAGRPARGRLADQRDDPGLPRHRRRQVHRDHRARRGLPVRGPRAHPERAGIAVKIAGSGRGRLQFGRLEEAALRPAPHRQHRDPEGEGPAAH